MKLRIAFPAGRLTLASAVLALAASLLAPAPGEAAGAPTLEETPGVVPIVSRFPLGDTVYKQNCASCHENGLARAPQRIVLSYMTPEAIHRALTSGSMQAQGSALNDEQKVAVAQHLANTEMGAAQDMPALKMCEGEQAVFDRSKTPPFANWGFDKHGSHAIPGDVAGIGKDDLGNLKLKWAFGFAGANRARSQPALGGGAIFVGAQDGSVFALDRETGCVRWNYMALAEVRTGIVLDPWDANDASANPLAYFGDFAGNAYAVEAFTGKQVWKVEADPHPASVLTGTPSLHDGTLFVPISSLEEASAASPGYKCCDFRGSVLALDAATGTERWRTYMVGVPVKQEPESNGTVFLGPSGVAVWTAPVVDEKRGLLYVTTGDNYTNPATELSDAVVALDLESGAIRWHNQVTEGDAWNVACYVQTGNCPEDAGPDYDFGSAPILAKGKDGKQYLLAGQKSGIAYGFDPDTHELLWQTRLGRGGAAGGIHFGIAAADGTLFAPVSDLPTGEPADFPLSPGVYALDIASGKRLWDAPSPDTCGERKHCIKGYAAAISVSEDLLFAGSDDGHLRIFDSATGEVLWDFDALKDFKTVNGVNAHGGAFSGGSAPVVEGGQLIVPSGYGFASKMTGNVLLVFEAE
ncbi:MAG: PQQ-binding-like beta-propeller repeat protein [Novosphingobium sp.]|nr:PQQ-binding-like beta-propeller repeat protein [Novosphingobium sp.]